MDLEQATKATAGTTIAMGGLLGVSDKMDLLVDNALLVGIVVGVSSLILHLIFGVINTTLNYKRLDLKNQKRELKLLKSQLDKKGQMTNDGTVIKGPYS